MLARSLARLLRPQNRGQTQPANPRDLQRWISLADMVAGVRLTMDEAFQVSAVWACISAISKALAASPYKVFQQLPNGDRDQLFSDPLVYLMNTRPNPDMTAIAYREAMMISALSWGCGYSEIVFDNAGRVAELWPLLPDRVTPEREASGRRVYRYRNPDNGSEVTLQDWQVLAIHGPSLDGLLGMNMVAHAAKTIALSMAAEKFSSTYFGNNTVVSGVLEYPNTLSDEAYNRLKKSWEERHQGPGNANRPAILEGGMKWNSISNKPEESQLIESRKFQLEEIARWYGVPPHKIGHLDRATWNNIEHLGIEFTRDALTPWAKRIEQEADYKLFSARGRPRFCTVDLEWLSQGDAKSRAESKAILRRNGVISVNDWLRSENQNTIGEEGDIRIVESNMVRLQDVGKQASPPPEPEDEDTVTVEDAATASARFLGRVTVEDAATAMLTSAFERHGKRIKNRAADLLARNKPGEEITQNLMRLREQTLREDFLASARFLARLAQVDADAIVDTCAGWAQEECAPEIAAQAVVQRYTGTDAELSAAVQALSGGR